MHDSTFNPKSDSISIPFPDPFNWEETLRYLSRSPNECVFRVIDGVVYRVVNLPSARVLIEISAAQQGLVVRAQGPSSLDTEQWTLVATFIRDWFDLDTHLLPFYHNARNCPLLTDLVVPFYGLRVIGVPDLFEAICWAIIGQQINLTFAYTLKRRFVESFGDSIVWDGQVYWQFPEPERIASLSVEALLSLKMTRRKAETLLDVARLMVDGRLSKAQLLASGDPQLAEQQLLKIRGLGPWSANYVRMRCLHDPSAFPVTDVGLHNAVKQRLGSDRKPTIEELKEIAQNWSGWEAYATFYLWQSLSTVAKP